MPRTARKKSSECIYHVMSRSISEVNLFLCNDDKDYYLKLLKRYKIKYHCKIYAFVLMDNHVHLYIDPCGFDISTFMHSLNTAYVVYFNKKYNRHGHLFQGRFASSIVDNDTYSLTLSAYIHNNPKDIPGYAGREEQYAYSSYGIYTGYREDSDELVDTDFILGQFGIDKKTAQKRYKAFTESMKESGIMKEINDDILKAFTENTYNSGKRFIIRDRTPEELIDKISKLLGGLFGVRLKEYLRAKYSRKTSKVRAFLTYVMRVLCGYTYQEICEYIGNMTLSGISNLTSRGFKLIQENKKYRDTFNALLQIEG